MNDFYLRVLSSDEYILLYLKCFINEIYLCKKIIKYKNIIENQDIMKYHIDRWNNIAGYHYIIHDTHQGKFSFIFDNKDYIIKTDHRLEFYYNTGLSYQIVELIHELIKARHELNIFYKGDYKDKLKDEDKLYSILSYNIMKAMKKKI